MLSKDTISSFIQGVLRSYSQIFFSDGNWFAVPLIAVSFIDISAGFCGLLCVLSANLSAALMKFDKITILKGYYGFNGLLVGLGIGYYYELTFIVIAITVISGFLTLLITITLQGILGKYYLPYLSVPFVLCLWIVLSAVGMLHGTIYNQSGVYILNKLFTIGGHPLVNLHQWWVGNVTSDFLNSYFMSLGAIFFQFNVFAGIVIAVALFSYSRIAFLLSLLGYSVAWLAYSFFGIDMTQLGYSYIGFNFIMGSIAVGGYFYIPSRQSFFWAFAITPVIALVAAGLFILLKPFNLTLLSLPFNLVLLTFIYSLRFRKEQSHFKEVQFQEGTPEANLYSYQSFTKRFPNFGWLQIKLPFVGEWCINQGNHGEHTHKGEWADAWDFVIIDKDLSQFKNEGNELRDYYCFGQNVIAPAEGTVVVAEDGIEDNKTGDVNVSKNWGNTVIIKHAEGLYSKMCHLQNGTISVKAGDFVLYGKIVGKAGNSGRSPYPHLHFQLQPTPYIGSKTLKYPLFAYLEDGKEIRTFHAPSNGQCVKSVEVNSILKEAFNLMPGTTLNWDVITPEGNSQVSWEIFTNLYNRSYIYCNNTKSLAYFYSDSVNFYFTHFEGSRKSLLYYFYLSAFRIPLVHIKSNITADSLPVNRTFNGYRLFFHDFTAPFFIYLKAIYRVEMERVGSEFDTDYFEYKSKVDGYCFSRLVWTREFRLRVNRNNSFKFVNESLNIEATCDSF